MPKNGRGYEFSRYGRELLAFGMDFVISGQGNADDNIFGLTMQCMLTDPPIYSAKKLICLPPSKAVRSTMMEW